MREHIDTSLGARLGDALSYTTKVLHDTAYNAVAAVSPPHRLLAVVSGLTIFASAAGMYGTDTGQRALRAVPVVGAPVADLLQPGYEERELETTVQEHSLIELEDAATVQQQALTDLYTPQD